MICPWTQLRKIEEDLWPADPVHMDEKGYAAVAGLILATLKHNGGLDLDQRKKSGSRGDSCSGGSHDGGGASGSGGSDENNSGGRSGATPSGGTWRPRGRGGRGRGWRGRHIH